MPRLWNSTIESHRQAVRDAILDTTALLISERGLTAVTMSQIAERAGIGRATLYKYFPDIEAILRAWHQRHVRAHVQRLTELRSGGGQPWRCLEAVLEGYAEIAYHRGRHGGDLTALLHQGEHVGQAERELVDLLTSLLTEVAISGGLRGDVAPKELAQFCLHALGAASRLPSQAAVRRLVAVTMSGLRPPT